MVTVKVEINANKAIKRIIKNDITGTFVAQAVAKHSDKYIPARTLTLAQTYNIRPWEIEYTSPYAHRIFTGDSFNFSTDVHPLATARWDKVTEEKQGNAIAKEVTRFIESR